jgi:hypothetical protein
MMRRHSINEGVVPKADLLLGHYSRGTNLESDEKGIE